MFCEWYHWNRNFLLIPKRTAEDFITEYTLHVFVNVIDGNLLVYGLFLIITEYREHLEFIMYYGGNTTD